MSEFASLFEFVKWIVYSGGAILFVSWLLEQIPAFGALASKTKYWIALLSSVAVSVAFYAVITYTPPEVWGLLDPWFGVIMGTIITFSGGQIYHAATKPTR